jgi:maltooligosyltrehalose trehalohydrolase
MTGTSDEAAVGAPARWNASFGAMARPDGVLFRVWAPAARELTLRLRDSAGTRSYRPRRNADGIWELFAPGVRAGARYAYSIDGSDPRPDPASRFQPDGVHGWSEVIDPAAFIWSDDAWEGVDPGRVVLYELHVGTFADDGTFASVAARLAYLRDLGITAIELMPIAEFAGTRNWGYDGASLFAPSHTYGRPDDLRALVDSAHRAGLAVIVDVVYNHLGPEGAYLPSFSPQFLTDAHTTPWGNAVNLDADGSHVVRQLLTDNALHWIHEYHMDGLRLDATHALMDASDHPFVAELTTIVHRARTPRPFVFAEDHRNLASMVAHTKEGGWGLDGVWADDFHHVVRRMLAGDARGYYVDYKGRVEELAATLQRGWLYTGQQSAYKQKPRGTDPTNVAMRTAIIALQNHDQVGNRAVGDRLHQTIDVAQWRAAVALLLTAPMTPLLFMGQEWAATTPFLFFTDFEPELGERVIAGRRREFEAFPEFASPDAARRIPSPQAPETFAASRLKWAEQRQPEHAAVLALHRALLHLRAEYAALQASQACTSAADVLDDSTVLVTRSDPEGATSFVVCARLRGAGQIVLGPQRVSPRRLVLTTEDAAFALDARRPVVDLDRGAITFFRPGAVILAIADRAGVS